MHMPMRRRSRLRRVFKWAGLVVCVLLTLMIAASRWWSVERRGGTYGGIIGRGRLVVLKYGNPDLVDWQLRRNTPPGFLSWSTLRVGATPVVHLRTPLWMLLAIVAVPTVCLWRRDRRHPAGHCSACGYDLTGNLSGVCSECGEQVGFASNSRS